jgi:hypothetical protein
MKDFIFASRFVKEIPVAGEWREIFFLLRPNKNDFMMKILRN